MDSPVRDAWLTIPSPAVTIPSNGITVPIWILTSSPGLIWSEFTRTSPPSVTSHTLLTLRDMLLARSSTDFLCVQSSRISPKPNRNITEDAVEKSPRKMDTPIAVASSTDTSILRFARVRIPFQIYFIECNVVSTVLTGIGRNSFLP